MQPQSTDRPRPRGRWGWALTILILLLSLYPISRSVGSGDWFSVALLATLDVLMVTARIAMARKVAALHHGDTDDPPPGVSGR